MPPLRLRAALSDGQLAQLHFHSVIDEAVARRVVGDERPPEGLI
jgi:hypothetical protein